MRQIDRQTDRLSGSNGLDRVRQIDRQTNRLSGSNESLIYLR